MPPPRGRRSRPARFDEAAVAPSSLAPGRSTSATSANARPAARHRGAPLSHTQRRRPRREFHGARKNHQRGININESSHIYRAVAVTRGAALLSIGGARGRRGGATCSGTVRISSSSSVSAATARPRVSEDVWVPVRLHVPGARARAVEVNARASSFLRAACNCRYPAHALKLQHVARRFRLCWRAVPARRSGKMVAPGEPPRCVLRRAPAVLLRLSASPSHRASDRSLERLHHASGPPCRVNVRGGLHLLHERGDPIARDTVFCARRALGDPARACCVSAATAFRREPPRASPLPRRWRRASTIVPVRSRRAWGTAGIGR